MSTKKYTKFVTNNKFIKEYEAIWKEYRVFEDTLQHISPQLALLLFSTFFSSFRLRSVQILRTHFYTRPCTLPLTYITDTSSVNPHFLLKETRALTTKWVRQQRLGWSKRWTRYIEFKRTRITLLAWPLYTYYIVNKYKRWLSIPWDSVECLVIQTKYKTNGRCRDTSKA